MNQHLKRISPEFQVSSKPPLDSASSLLRKRHSLHSVETFRKLSKHGHGGSEQDLQLLQRKENNSGSLGNLARLDSEKRSASLAHLKSSGRTLSASNLAALSDSNLSVQVALPLRSYESQGSQSNIAQKCFELNVKRYYNQLTVGCGNVGCWNKFCASNSTTKNLGQHVASVISIELATLGKEYFCQVNTDSNPCNLEPLPVKAFTNNDGKPGLFLQKLFRCSPFKFLFANSDVTTSNTKRKKHINTAVGKSGSLTDIKSKTSKFNSSALNTVTTSLSLSNINDTGKLENTGLTNPRTGSLLKPNFNTTHSSRSGLEFSTKDVKKESLDAVRHDFGIDIESVSVDGDSLEEFEAECVLEMSSGSLIKELSLTHLTLDMLETSVKNYKECRDPSFLLNTIRTVFTSPEAMNASFLVQQASSTTDQKQCLNIDSVRKAYWLLLGLEPKSVFQQPLKNSAEIHLKTLQSYDDIKPSQVNQLMVLLENPLVLETYELLQSYCDVVARLLPATKNAVIAEIVNYDTINFQKIIKAVHKLLSSQVHVNQCSESHIIVLCMMLDLLYHCNIESQRRGHQRVQLCQFYNEELSKKLDYKKEYGKWITKNTDDDTICDGLTEKLSSISVLDYPFVLEAASKVRIMHIHTAWQMGTEYRDAILYQAKVQQAKKAYEISDEFEVEDSVKNAMNPFLVLDVRRDHLIEDTLVQVKLKEHDLKKALKIRYVGGGEEGLDLGGLQKEFFHIIINDIIQPDYGMFVYLDQVERMWINSSLLKEDDVMFELVGTLLGIAIYNGIILDLHFPPVIYKKLQGHKVELADLKNVDPSLARSLQALLDYDGDVEDTFCYTFQIAHTVFGTSVNVDLKENGADLPVTNDNRVEFVALYVDYLLNKSIQRQFGAFNLGFHKVCDDTCLKLFQVEELELLICGSPDIDFTLIEESTDYQNGFTPDTPTIVAFWDIVHHMNMDEKKSLLSFVTGSDRVPLKGLSAVAFHVIKQGEDTDKLPTALTCFNQLMLPDYATREKLYNRLLLAIQNSKGFGLT